MIYEYNINVLINNREMCHSQYIKYNHDIFKLKMAFAFFQVLNFEVNRNSTRYYI